MENKGNVEIVLEDYKLSENFSFGEFTRTSHRKYLSLNRKEGVKYLDNLHKLCEIILEPARALIEAPAFITSGFRCYKLNRAIGGSKNSQHTVGEAADIEFLGAREGRPLKEAFNTIAFSDIPYSQIIFEYGQWIHIGLQDTDLYPGKEKEKLVATRHNGKTIYTLIQKPI